MAVKIRLARVGRRKSPYYRLVVADSRAPRDGRFIEILGVYQPLNKKPHIKIDETRALHWLYKGALPSETVRSLFRQLGIMKRYHESKATEKKTAT